MANKKTIAQLESELDRLFRRLKIITGAIDKRRDLIKKIRLGKVKQPEPPGLKVMIKELQALRKQDAQDFDDAVSDIASGYGGSPAGG